MTIIIKLVKVVFMFLAKLRENPYWLNINISFIHNVAFQLFKNIKYKSEQNPSTVYFLYNQCNHVRQIIRVRKLNWAETIYEGHLSEGKLMLEKKNVTRVC